ncbi:hypothetical protein B0H11DRAFT_2037540 [Mycena galericulata]|nr:hypothetical protein B0H11DRAFT_2037540 [Mycena galericulata]
MSGPSNTRHLLFVPIPAYGHIRPLCSLAGRLAQAPNIVITVLVAGNWLEKTKFDVAAQYPKDHEALSRIRVISLFEPTDENMFNILPEMQAHYPPAYEKLFRAKAVHCATTGKEYAAVPRPSVIIGDIFGFAQLNATRAISGTAIPILTFIAGNAGSIIRVFGPESLGGLGDVRAKIDAQVLQTGDSTDDVAEQILRPANGNVVKIPGVPAMFDFEFYPQNLPFNGRMGTLLNSGKEMIAACDGVVLGLGRAYEGESLVALENWATSSLHVPVYTVGPLLPPGYGERNTWSPSPRDKHIKLFLDDSQSKYGENSVLLISFGTAFWPTVQDQLEELINALIEKKFPFILCHASPFATIPASLAEKIKTSGIGLATSWCPQQQTLSHPATGWFLTHGGHGGLTESLANGVPMICWPFDADQPIAAAHLTENLNVAFHLIEVRTGHGLRPMHNGRVPRGTREAYSAEFRETLDKCRGKQGIEKRQNALRIKHELAGAWVEGGSSQMTIQEFITKYAV